MFKRMIIAVAALVTLLLSVVCVEAAKPDKWLIYWYACGTDIETAGIAFGVRTDLMSGRQGDLSLAQPVREPGDVTRCIKEIERANLSPNVKIFMQAGGTYIWGHEKFRDLNAKIQTGLRGNVIGNGNAHYKQWFLTGGNGNTVAKPVENGKLGRYVYDKYHRNWMPREQLPITGDPDKNTRNETDMGSEAGFVSFLRSGQKLEQELYPDGNVRRVLIIKDHGSGINGVCKDEYTKNTMSLQEMQDAFKEVKDDWTNPDGKPFEVVAFDACVMSLYETTVAVEDAAKYMVASQESTYNKVGLDYTGLLNELSKNPTMSGKELGKVICKTTWEDSKVVDKEFGLNSTTVFTESVIDLSERKMNALKKSYANFNEEATKVARENPDDVVRNFAKFKNAAEMSERFSIIGGGTPDMVDLKNFSDNVKSVFPELKDVGDELVKALNDSVVYNKRGSAFKRGGGLSVHDPLGSIYRGMQIRAVDISGLKDEPIEVDEEKKTVSVELNEEALKNVDSVRCQVMYVGANSYDEVQVKYLGSDSSMKSDWESGKFTSTFSGKWLTINDQPVCAAVVSDSTRQDKRGKKVGGSEMYSIPIQYNGEICNLFVSCKYPDRKFTMIGVAPRPGSSGMPSGELYGINPGDVIVPVYFDVGLSEETEEKVQKMSEDLEMKAQRSYGKSIKELTEEEAENLFAYDLVAKSQEMYGKNFRALTREQQTRVFEEYMQGMFKRSYGTPINVDDKKIKIGIGNLPDGNYSYSFEFVNPTGGENVQTKEMAIFRIRKGKVVEVNHSNDIEDLKDLS